MPEGGPTRVYANVLYWSERELALVERCLESLRAQDAAAAELRLLAIDNGSGLTPRLPDGVQLLRLRENLGFAGGHNAGLREALEAGADYVFLVNSDLVLEASCLRVLLEAARGRPTAGMLGPLVVSERAPGEVESNGQAFDTRTGRHRELDKRRCARDIDPRPHAVDVVSGCALLASRAVLERAGLLDESLYLYFEDVDWCLRAGRLGFQVAVVPRAQVVHLGSGSSAPGWPGKTFYSVRNHLVVACRYAQGPLRWVLPPLVVTYHLAFLLSNRDHATRAHLGALVRGAFAAGTGRMGAQAKLASSH